jgi:hypothetical protein
MYLLCLILVFNLENLARSNDILLLIEDLPAPFTLSILQQQSI